MYNIRYDPSFTTRLAGVRRGSRNAAKMDRLTPSAKTDRFRPSVKTDRFRPSVKTDRFRPSVKAVIHPISLKQNIIVL